MKVNLVGSWQFELVPEDADEVKVLEKAFLGGHVHFVCKALSKESTLLLTPSVVRWRKSKRGELG